MKQFLVSVVAILAAAPALGATLYGVGSFGPFSAQGLYTIDTATGAASFVGDTGVDELVGLSFDATSGAMYSYSTDGELYTIDLGTGAASLVDNALGIVPEGGIAFDGSGNLFGVDAGDLITINTTDASRNVVGALAPFAGSDISGLTFDGANLLGFAKNAGADDSLVTINPATGAVISDVTIDLDSNPSVGGLDIDPDTGNLFLTDGASLYGVTGSAVSFVGNHGVDNFSGLAFIPEPSSMLLVALGGLMLRRRSA